MCYLKDVIKRVQIQNNLNVLKQPIVIGRKLPECRNCLYFENRKNYNEDGTISFHKECTKFVNKSVVDGNFYFSSPSINRYNETLCGINGKFYINKNEFFESEFETNDDLHKN